LPVLALFWLLLPVLATASVPLLAQLHFLARQALPLLVLVPVLAQLPAPVLALLQVLLPVLELRRAAAALPPTALLPPYQAVLAAPLQVV
jgi:hypothetical protein